MSGLTNWRHGLGFWLIAALPVLALERPYQVVARQGEPAPSDGVGAGYGIISSNPVIGAAGHIAFAGFVDRGGGNFAVWSGLPGAIEKLAMTNDPAPGRPGAGLDIFGVGEIRANPNGSVAFRAKVLGSDTGIWIGRPGSLREVAIVNNQVSGFTDGTSYVNFPGFDYVSNGSGLVSLRATVTTPGETILLSGAPGGLEVVARQDAYLPDQAGSRYGSLTFIGQSMNARGVVLANVPLKTGDLSNDNALIKDEPGAFRILFQEGQPVPGLPGAAFDAFGKPRIANDGGVVFENDLRGIEIGRTFFYHRPDEGLHALVTEGKQTRHPNTQTNKTPT